MFVLVFHLFLLFYSVSCCHFFIYPRNLLFVTILKLNPFAGQVEYMCDMLMLPVEEALRLFNAYSYCFRNQAKVFSRIYLFRWRQNLLFVTRVLEQNQVMHVEANGSIVFSLMQ